MKPLLAALCLCLAPLAAQAQSSRVDLSGIDPAQVLAGAGDVLQRAPDADIAFPDPEGRAVSRRHALLWLASDDASGWHVVDLESTGGTHLNGRRVQAQRLMHGDLLALGEQGPSLRVELTRERSVAVTVLPADRVDRSTQDSGGERPDPT